MRRLPFGLDLVEAVYAGRKTQTRRPGSASLLGGVGDELLVAEPLVPIEAAGSGLVAAYAVDRELVRGGGGLLPWKNPARRFLPAA